MRASPVIPCARVPDKNVIRVKHGKFVGTKAFAGRHLIIPRITSVVLLHPSQIPTLATHGAFPKNELFIVPVGMGTRPGHAPLPGENMHYFSHLFSSKHNLPSQQRPLWRGVGGGGPSLQIPPLTHILLARSPAPYSPFPPRRALSSGPMARPVRAPCSHPQTGPPDSATSPVMVLY